MVSQSIAKHRIHQLCDCITMDYFARCCEMQLSQKSYYYHKYFCLEWGMGSFDKFWNHEPLRSNLPMRNLILKKRIPTKPQLAGSLYIYFFKGKPVRAKGPNEEPGRRKLFGGMVDLEEVPYQRSGFHFSATQLARKSNDRTKGSKSSKNDVCIFKRK